MQPSRLLKIRHHFPASLRGVDDFCIKIKKFMADNGLTEDIFGVQLLLREVLTNAVLHGSNNDPTYSVACDLELVRDELIIAVEDQGQGFDWRATKCIADDTTMTSGRGVPLYYLYADTVTFNEQGNRVVLHKRLKKTRRSTTCRNTR